MKIYKTFLILIGISILTASFVSASDILEWQGQYYTGTTFNIGTYIFNFTVYDAMTGGDACYTNTTNITTGELGQWQTEQYGVNSACNDPTKDYYLNININGVDQTPRRLLTRLSLVRKDINQTLYGAIQTDSLIIAPVINVTQYGFFYYLGSLTNRITKLFVQDIDFSGNINGTGTVTASNIFLPQYIFTGVQSDQKLVSANLFQNISYNDTQQDLSQGIIHNPLDNTNDTFIIATSGIYSITFRNNFEDSSGATHHVNSIIAKNGIEINNSNTEVDITTANLDFTDSNSIFANLTTGDNISFEWTATSKTVSLSTDGTNGLHKTSSDITIRRIA